MTLLSQLEEVWVRCEASPSLLSHLTQCSAKALLGTQSDLTDLVQFSSAALTTCITTTEDKQGLTQFTERLLSAVHLTSHQHFTSEDFNQSRYLDCIAAILSVWLDLTSSDVIWPKLWLYNHGSHHHILDTLLQCSNIRTNMIERALQQITSIPSIQLFLRYVLCLRHVTLPRYKLFAISNQPDINIYRLWLIKNNISSSIPILELINSSKHDQHILSALCSASSYTLPSQCEEQPMITEDTLYVTAPLEEESADTMFFIDRGVPEAVIEDVVNKDILNVTLEPALPDSIEDLEPIRINNQKASKKQKACSNVIIAGSSPRQTRSKRSKVEEAALPAEATVQEKDAEEEIVVEDKAPEPIISVAPAEETAEETMGQDTVKPVESELSALDTLADLAEKVRSRSSSSEVAAGAEEAIQEAAEAIAEAEAVFTKDTVPSPTQKTSLEALAETEAIIDNALAPEEDSLDATLTDPTPALLPLTPHNISLLNTTADTVPADDNVSMTSSLRRSSRKRNSSAGSEVSVESVASRTRNRKKPGLEAVQEMETIAEKDVVVEKSVKKKQTGRKSGIPIAKASKAKKAKIETVVEEPVVKTPAQKSTTKKKARKLSNTEVVEETPQIPVKRTRSRKLDV